MHGKVHVPIILTCEPFSLIRTCFPSGLRRAKEQTGIFAFHFQVALQSYVFILKQKFNGLLKPLCMRPFLPNYCIDSPRVVDISVSCDGRAEGLILKS